MALLPEAVSKAQEDRKGAAIFAAVNENGVPSAIQVGCMSKFSEEIFKKINKAKRILMSYCAFYRYSFAAQDVKEVTSEAFSEEHVKRFYEYFI